MKICYIHIGAPKTGSTALQKFLSTNRDLLIRQNILYPDVSLRGWGHHDIAFLVHGYYPDWATPQKRSLDELLNELKKAAANHSGTLLLSSENFYLYPSPEKLAEALCKCGILPRSKVTIVVYIRRQDTAHESWYNQTIKAQGYTHCIEESIAEFRTLWDYSVNLDKWSSVFGLDNILVRPYEHDVLVNGDICFDFLQLLGLSADGFKFSQKHDNTRINYDILEFQRCMNRLPMAPQVKRKFHKHLIELTAATQDMGLFDDSPLLSRRQRYEILDYYQQSNDAVAQLYLKQSQLFSEAIAETKNNSVSSRGLTPEKLTYILGWIIAQLD